MLFRSRIVLETLLLGFVLQAYGQMKDGSNAKQYGILCDIYNVAANSPSFLYDPSEIEKIRDEIDVINASLSQDGSFSEMSDPEFQENLTGKFKFRNNNEASKWNRWTNAVKKVSSNSTNFMKIPSTNLSIKRARKKLINIVKQVETIIDTIKAANAAASLDRIKKDFGDVIGQVGDHTTAIDRAKSCGKPGDRSSGAPGEKAGIFLIMDFLCLCGVSSSNSVRNVCGYDVKDISWDTNRWSGKGLSDDTGGETWKILREGCGNRGKQKLANSIAGYEALGEFLTAISKETTIAGENKPGLFGSVYSGRDPTCQDKGEGCSGQKCKGGGACVYYGGKRKDGGKDIPWVQKFRSGLEKLEKIQNINASITADITLLKMLRIHAEEIYEDAKASLELEEENHEIYTAYNTTVSRSHKPYFVFPWILLT
ncbi:Variant surface glycoprotein [Trypanosoma congolense IL3000]|uniref:Variant surface glycoprotein n=1 Tax=Trypanosoma congolense (strain IL3000) TaxID=1068625 RepID=F9WBP1_TRYCI|nr:Variant surface glycoprotein [Trypanosoma congolense IL3000]